MTLHRHAFALVVFCSLPAWAAAPERPGVGGIETIADLPGWWHAGSNPRGYLTGVDRAVTRGGRASARLKSKGASPTGFGSLMQMSSAEKYRGKRVRMSAWVRSENVARHSGLWMRVDGPGGDPSKPLAADAMQDRGIVGTHDWQRYEIILDVAPEAADIAYGAHLSGDGTLWIDDVQLEEVSDRVPVTGPHTPPSDTERVFQEIQRSHIDGNVPDAADFERFLRRDLADYFAAARKMKSVPVEYEPLRRGPTQSGVSYPKFYLWVRIAGGKTPQDRGAVRVAAVEKERFEVTDFISEETIRNTPTGLAQIFPAQVCETINAKVAP